MDQREGERERKKRNHRCWDEGGGKTNPVFVAVNVVSVLRPGFPVRRLFVVYIAQALSNYCTDATRTRGVWSQIHSLRHNLSRLYSRSHRSARNVDTFIKHTWDVPSHSSPPDRDRHPQLQSSAPVYVPTCQRSPGPCPALLTPGGDGSFPVKECITTHRSNHPVTPPPFPPTVLRYHDIPTMRCAQGGGERSESRARWRSDSRSIR